MGIPSKTPGSMRQQGPKTGLADIRNKKINEEHSNTKRIIESKASKKDKKEAILADARKKKGIDEEKRQDFKKRTAEVRAKRNQKPKAEKPATTPSKGPLRRQDGVIASRMEARKTV